MSGPPKLKRKIPRIRLGAPKRAGEEDCPSTSPPALDENLAAIQGWEKRLQQERTRAEQVGDWITATFASGPVLLGHLLWFFLWIVLNSNVLPGIEPFDAFPYPFLTMAVSLEAIFLALFVLASQNSLARQSDKRAHLDLQVDLLAEREMTAVLQLLQDIAAHLGVECTHAPEQIRDLLQKTDIRDLTQKLETIGGGDESGPAAGGDGKEPASPAASASPSAREIADSPATKG
jgi:uncharacterized membrane protein